MIRIWRYRLAGAIAIGCLIAGAIFATIGPVIRSDRSTRHALAEAERAIEEDVREPDVVESRRAESKPLAVALPDGFVGTATCASCHPAQHESYLETHHSRSLYRPQLTPSSDAQAQQLGKLVHQLSRRSYEVLEKDGKLWHREWQHFWDISGNGDYASPLSEADPRMTVTELPLSHVMGSGAFAMGYLLADKEFLLQSPVTWYSKPQAFGMAPGYDRKAHSGMTRVISDDCLFCHAGMVSRIDNNDEKLVVLETAISCERCHGAGQQHAAQFKDYVVEPGSDDSAAESANIVHPGKLERTLTEAICAQCHLQGDIVVQQSGKRVWDFRPGERFEENRVLYKIDHLGGEEKTFVDHFDQLWQSKCYMQSDSLTCITCHDPHLHQTGGSAEALQQANCMKCHDHDACGLGLADRQTQMQNQCVGCHMPKSASEVPHAATTNHQIAIYPLVAATLSENSSSSLRKLHSPLDPTADATDRRTELLAHAHWILDHVDGDGISALVRDRTLADLVKLAESSEEESQLFATIARLARHIAESLSQEEQHLASIEQHWQIAVQYAQRTLEIESAATTSRKAALEVLGAKQFDDGRFGDAVKTYLELTKIRRSPIDWYNLGLCWGRLKQFSAAEQAFIEAIRLDATYAAPYRSLAVLYAAANPPLAEGMHRTYQWLQRLR